jgi:predicted transcriptional regulator
MKYPNSPGFKDLTTSKEAAKKIEPKAKTLRDACLKVLMLQSLTPDEVAAHLGESILSVRPRISELFKQGLIKTTGVRRMNESGNRAHVYKAIKEEKAEQLDIFKRAA